MNPFAAKGIVEIDNNLYVKDRLVMSDLVATLEKTGYRVSDLHHYRNENNSRSNLCTPQWYVYLPHLEKGKCNSCQSLIKTSGIFRHGHRCENCGEYTCLEVVDGGLITFVFAEDDTETNNLFFPTVSFIAKCWDEENGWLYLYPKLQVGKRRSLPETEAQKYLDNHRKQCEQIDLDGQKLIRVKYIKRDHQEQSDILVVEIAGGYRNATIVKVWQGKEYKDNEKLPIPESFHIYESWTWKPFPVSRLLFLKLIEITGKRSEISYYGTDTSPVFVAEDWQKAATFVREFTSIDPDAFDHAWPRFRKSGPGGLIDLASFLASQKNK